MSEPPRSFLSVTKNISEIEASVTQIELEHGVSAGIHLRSLVDGLVPTYEEHAARLEGGIRLKDWEAMEYMEKVILIAHRRLRQAVHNLQEEAQIRDVERKSKRKKH